MHIDDIPEYSNQYGDWCDRPVNAFLSGSRKYGRPRDDSDYDIVIYVAEPFPVGLPFYEAEKPMRFDNVLFNADGGVYTDEPPKPADLNFSPDMNVIDCTMTLVDLLRIGTRETVDNVNLIPVKNPELWAIWVQGTIALTALAKAGVIVDREYAIDMFSQFGLPRGDFS